MDFISYRGITLILIGRSVTQLICVYDVYLDVPLSFNSLKTLLLKKCLYGLIHAEQITSSSLVVHLKFKCLLKKPTQYDIIEAKKGQGAQRGEIGPITEMCKNAICF